MLKQRALSSVVIVALTLGAAILGRLAFTLFTTVVLGLTARELFALFQHAGHRPLTVAGYATVATLPAIALTRQWGAWSAPLIAAVVFLPLLPILFRRDHTGALTDWALTVAGALYIGLPAAHFVLLRELPGNLGSIADWLDASGRWQLRGYDATARGLSWFLLAQVVTWLTDVGAYLVGHRWGRRKLAPRISPGKSVEGAAGGLVAGALSAWGCAALVGLGLHPLVALGAGLLLSLAGQLGDLAESLLKRQAGVKDSGALVPGHGGILDRLDSLLVVVVVTYYLALLTG